MPHDTILSVARHPTEPGLEAVRGVGVAADIGRHAHAGLVVGLCLAGGRRIVSGGGEWIVPPGGGFIIPPGLPHACSPASSSCGGAGHSYLVLVVAPMLCQAVRRADPALAGSLRCFRQRDAAALVVRLAEAIAQGDEQALPLFHFLAEVLDLRVTSAPVPHPATLRAKAAIDAAPERPHPVAALARLAGVSPFHLERLFVRDLGVPLGEYALGRRVRLAAARIGAGVPLAEAALAAGFYDQSHLTRHFRRRMGVPPGRYSEGG